MADIIAGNESKALATKLVSQAVEDKCLGNTDVMVARIAVALEQSWVQGLEDGETWQRVMQARKGVK